MKIPFRIDLLPIPDLPLFKVISDLSKELNVECYLVGGYIRDILMKRSKDTKDLDFVVIDPKKSINKLGIYFAEKLVEKLTFIGKVSDVNTFANFGTAQIKFNGIDIEIVGARKESYDRNSRKPVVEDGTFKDDSERRDFTINDIYLPIHDIEKEYLIDPFGGVRDIENKILRTPKNPDITFSDDPLRILRAIRFATTLNFKISGLTKGSIEKNKDRIKILSVERITTELNKILTSEFAHDGIQLLEQLGLLEIILPEVYALKGKEGRKGKEGHLVFHKNNLNHVKDVVRNLDSSKYKNDLWMKWVALLHDTGKPLKKRFDPNAKQKNLKGETIYGQWYFENHEIESLKITERVFRRLKLPLNDELKEVLYIIKMHEKIKLPVNEVTDSAIRRRIVEAQELFGTEAILLKAFDFGIADVTSEIPERVEFYTNSFKELKNMVLEVIEKDNLRNFKLAIDGDELMKIFNLKPSREVGILKNAIKDAVLDGKIKNDYQACLDYIIEFRKTLKQ